MSRRSQRDFGRRPPRFEAGRKVLIVCEGEKTEPQYFKAIRQFLRLPSRLVQVHAADGPDPLSVVKCAMRRREENENWRNGDTAWAVYDVDDYPNQSPQNWGEAQRLAERNGIRLAITNPCFELWYLLHFQDQRANLSRGGATWALSSHIPGYDKANAYYLSLLQPLTQDAIQRARQMAQRAEEENKKLHEYPCAVGIADLVELLLGLKREE